MPDNQAVALKLLDASDVDLYAEIGRELTGTSVVAPRVQDLIQHGRRWMNSKRIEIANVACQNEQIKALAAPTLSAHERVVLVCAFADIISHLVTGVAPITVAALLTRQGVQSLCESIWSDLAVRAPDETNR
jgi:hypothetical protein